MDASVLAAAALTIAGVTAVTFIIKSARARPAPGAPRMIVACVALLAAVVLLFAPITASTGAVCGGLVATTTLGAEMREGREEASNSIDRQSFDSCISRATAVVVTSLSLEVLAVALTLQRRSLRRGIPSRRL